MTNALQQNSKKDNIFRQGRRQQINHPSRSTESFRMFLVPVHKKLTENTESEFPLT